MHCFRHHQECNDFFWISPHKSTFMINRNLICLILLIGLVEVSCKRMVKGSGEMITDERITGNFETVEIKGAAVIEITKGSGYKVEVKSYENIVHLIETSVKNNKLTVSTGEDVSITNSEITIHITAPTIETVILSGAGDLAISGFHQSMMKLKLQGAGNIRFSGSECDTVYATLTGAGNMYVNAKDYLDANLNGIGNIEYAGDPTVKSKISGLGNVSKK